MDSELYKIKVACKSRKKLTNGFQGCTNNGRGCDFDGFYLCTYSPEGLCKDCESKQFPERYHGCCFCRKAIKYSLTCGNCEEGFRE
jgi:hypothetical protein